LAFCFPFSLCAIPVTSKCLNFSLFFFPSMLI
jgi:hypothetical protein